MDRNRLREIAGEGVAAGFDRVLQGMARAAGEAICRALLFAGVPVRHPELRFAFLEGGVNWACGLYSDFIGHWEKRNREEI